MRMRKDPLQVLKVHPTMLLPWGPGLLSELFHQLVISQYKNVLFKNCKHIKRENSPIAN